MAEEIKKSLIMPKAPKAPSTSVPSATKMPKVKMMPKATDKPSVFFKNEDFGNVKHPSIGKLKSFLENRISRKQS